MGRVKSIWNSVRKRLPAGSQPALVTLDGHPRVYLTEYHAGFGFDCDHVEYWADVPKGIEPDGPGHGNRT